MKQDFENTDLYRQMNALLTILERQQKEAEYYYSEAVTEANTPDPTTTPRSGLHDISDFVPSSKEPSGYTLFSQQSDKATRNALEISLQILEMLHANPSQAKDLKNMIKQKRGGFVLVEDAAEFLTRQIGYNALELESAFSQEEIRAYFERVEKINLLDELKSFIESHTETCNSILSSNTGFSEDEVQSKTDTFMADLVSGLDSPSAAQPSP